VLKDAEATALYGSRGANGVVLITTKRGNYEQAPQINFSASYGQAKGAKLWDLTTDCTTCAIGERMVGKYR
jgi:TonB-dependent SusC/RagA subfamily outer membrane receptor